MFIRKKYAHHFDESPDKPNAIEYYSNGIKMSESWTANGKLHRVDKPAVVEYYDDGKVCSHVWYNDGTRHREDGPAIVSYYKSGELKKEEWWNCGRLHRLLGPAIVYYNKSNFTLKMQGRIPLASEEWFIKGVDVTGQIVPWMLENNIDLNNLDDVMRLKLTWA